MVSKDLTFNLVGRDVNATASLRRVSIAAEDSSRSIKRSFGELPKYAALATLGATAAAVKMAADFQQTSTRLVTDAGESAGALEKVRTGMLGIAASTGTSAEEISSGMYTVESAGYHGAAGLKVMQAVAEGAKIGMADTKTVADALTTTLTDYGKAAGSPARAMSMLTATVSTGKTNMEALAGSLHSVMPAAASAGISLKELLGAVGTMTGEGISADQATQNLNNAISSLSSPSQVAQKEMAQMGLSFLDVSKNLGKRGLTGTFELLSAAVTSHMGKDGLVIQSAMNQSKIAAASARTEMEHFPPALKTLAGEFLNNTITQKQWTAGLKQLPVQTATLGRQFATTAKQAHGFSDLLKGGGGVAQTYNAAMQKMTGGMTGLQVALHLTGDHMGTFKSNVAAIGKSTTEAGGHVRGWAETQKNFNQQLAQAGVAMQVVGIRLGTTLLPALTGVARGFGGFFKDLQAGNPLARALAVTVGVAALALTGLYVTTKVYEGVARSAAMATAVFGFAQKTIAGETKLAAAAQWLFNIAMDANPIGLIILAIGALIAVIVLLVTHWKQVCAFLQSAWQATVGFLLAALKFVMTAFLEFVLLPVAIMQHWGQISAFIGALWNRIIAGIVAFIGGAIRWFQALPARILAVLANLPHLLYTVGVNIIQGLINGVVSMAGNIAKTLGNIAGGAISAAKNALGIHSPSVVFHNMGVNIGQGLTNGILGTTNQVAAASNRLADTVIGMFEKRKGGISKAAETAALHTLGSGTKTLEAEAAKRADLMKQATAAQKKLTADLKAQKKASDSSLKDSVMSDGDVTKFGATGDAIQGLQALVANTRRFKTDLQKLVKKGIDGNTLKQLIGAGVSGGGLTMADQLLANPSDFTQIVALQKQLASSAGSLASFAGQAEYGSTIKSDKSNLARLKGAEKVETWKMQHTAAGMINAIAKETHVHIHLTGHYAGTKDDLAKSITTAIRDAVRRGQLPKNVLTAL